MDWLNHFLTISFNDLNLFSFMLGMFYALMGVSTFGNPRKLWLQVVLYTVGVAVYYFGKSEGWLQ